MSAPLRSSLRPDPAEIVEKRRLGPALHAYRLRLLEPGARRRFDFRPGQFNMVYAPGVGEVAISISSDPEEESLEHTIRIVGRTTGAIERFEVGDVLGVRGPYGSAWPLEEARGMDLFVATGGLGCAPVTGAIDYVFRRRAQYGHVAIVHGVKAPSDLIHRERFEAWRREPDSEVWLSSDSASPAWRDRTGVVTELFEQVSFPAERTVAFLCGPEVMMRRAIALLRRRGLQDERIFLSLERNMKCAVALCGRCQLGPSFLCRDGPIFRLSAIARYFLTRGL